MQHDDPRFHAGRRWLDRSDRPRTVEIIDGDILTRFRRENLWVRTVIAGASGSTGRRVLISIRTLEAKFDSLPDFNQE
jgi:hypothetical protein